MAEKQTQAGARERPRIDEGQQGKEEQGTSSKEQPERGIQRREPSGTIEPWGLGRGWTSPFSMMGRMMADMDRVFEDFGFGRLLPRVFAPIGEVSSLAGVFVPEVEVFEREGKMVVRADLPGIKREDIHVTCDDQGLLIEGERKSSQEQKQKGFYHSERSYGAFCRRIPLPQGVDEQSCSASYDDGVLEIQFDVPKESRRTIEVGSRGGSEGKELSAEQEGASEKKKEEEVRH